MKSNKIDEKKQTGGTNAERQETYTSKRSGENISQLVPIVLVILALLFVVSFIFSGMNEIGLFGKIFGNLLYGLFSLPAWLIPALLCYFALVYRKETTNGTLRVRVAMTVGAFLTFLCIYFYFTVGIVGKEFNLSPVAIWREGQNFRGSGLVGSYLGYFFFRIFGRVGTPIVLFPLFTILMVFLFGLTPREAYVYCRAKIRQWKDGAVAKAKQRSHTGAEQRETSAVPESERGSSSFLGRSDEDIDVLSVGRKKPSLQDRGIEIDYETGEVVEKKEADPISRPTIRQYGVSAETETAGAAERASANTAFQPTPRRTIKKDIQTTVEPSQTTPMAEPESVQESSVDLVALLEQSRKDSVGGAFSHPEADPTESAQTAEILEKAPYAFPPESLLKSKPAVGNQDISDELNTNAYKLVETLRSFKVRTKVINVSRGPTITRYELAPEEGVRVRAISNLIDDIALNLATTGVRIEAPIPGKAAVGVEVPNKTRETVYLRDLIANDTFRSASAKLTVSVGMDVAGDPVYMDLAKLPHLLIAGTTGSGKSVCMNCLILSLLYKADPSEVKMIMIDPKKVEFSVYNGLPHLITPVVSSAKKAAGALSWAVGEMERRYELIETVGVRDIKSYNNITKDDPTKEFMPQLVIIIDE